MLAARDFNVFRISKMIRNFEGGNACFNANLGRCMKSNTGTSLKENQSPTSPSCSTHPSTFILNLFVSMSFFNALHGLVFVIAICWVAVHSTSLRNLFALIRLTQAHKIYHQSFFLRCAELHQTAIEALRISANNHR